MKLPTSDEKPLTVESKVDPEDSVELSPDMTNEKESLIKIIDKNTTQPLSEEQTSGKIADNVANGTNNTNSPEPKLANSMVQPIIQSENKKEEITSQSPKTETQENEYLSHDNLIRDFAEHADNIESNYDMDSDNSSPFDESQGCQNLDFR